MRTGKVPTMTALLSIQCNSGDWNREIYATERKEQSEGNSNPENITVSM